mgnify:CR=1 FL=1
MFLAVLAAGTFLISKSLNADPYFGVSVGQSEYKVDLTPVGGSSFDDDGTSTKFYGGYAFNKYFAAEATFYNFAEASIGAIETSPGSGNFVSASADMIGGGIYAVGMYPVTKKFNLMAKLGALGWSADLELNNDQVENKDRDLAYGIAASYGFTREVQVVAEWESFDSDNPEVSMFSLGFKFIIK